VPPFFLNNNRLVVHWKKGQVQRRAKRFKMLGPPSFSGSRLRVRPGAARGEFASAAPVPALWRSSRPPR